MLALGVVAGAGALFVTADDRRIERACDRWLGQRGSMRSVVSETQEASERAIAEGDTVVMPYFNDIDQVRSVMNRWASVGPSIQNGLHDNRPGGDGGNREDSAEFTMDLVNEGVTILGDLIESGTPAAALDWLPEAEARFQAFDDICLSAARDWRFFEYLSEYWKYGSDLSVESRWWVLGWMHDHEAARDDG